MSSEVLAICKPPLQVEVAPGLPVEWSTVTLGDVVEKLAAGVSVNADNRQIGEGEIGVLKTSCVSGGQFVPDEHKAVLADELDRVRTPVRAGSIIISRMNTPALVGANAYVDQDHPDLFLPDRLWQLRTNDRADCRWLSYSMQSASFRRFIDDIATGTSGSMKNISKERLLQAPLVLPPLDEQRRIAKVLRSVDEAIAAADGVVREWATTFGTLLDVAFAEGERANLGDICSLIYRYPGFYGFDQLEAGVPVIRGEHLRAGRISRDWADFYFVDPAFSARFPKTILQLHDVVMSVRGTVGTTAVVDAAHVGSQISPNLIRLVANPGKIVPPLLYYAVQSAVAHMRRTIVNAQALPAINAGDLKQVEIALPSLADQPALLAELNGAAVAGADAVSAAQQARHVKVVVMSDLLSGRVRVPA